MTLTDTEEEINPLVDQHHLPVLQGGKQVTETGGKHGGGRTGRVPHGQVITREVEGAGEILSI